MLLFFEALIQASLQLWQTKTSRFHSVLQLSPLLGCPEMEAHIHVAIGLKAGSFVLQEKPMLQPARGGAAIFVHHAMTGQQVRSGGIRQRMSHHSRMIGPACPGRYDSVGNDLTARYLRDDEEHIVPELPCLLQRHGAVVIVHISRR